MVLRGGVSRRRPAAVVFPRRAQRDGRRPPGLSRQSRRRVRRGRARLTGSGVCGWACSSSSSSPRGRSRTSGSWPIPCAPGRTRCGGRPRRPTLCAPSPSRTQSGPIPEPKRRSFRPRRLFPENHRYWANLGLYYAETGRLERAVPALREAVRRAPQEALVRDYLGQLLLRLGREDEAIAEFEAALTGVPPSAQPYTNLAEVLLRRGQNERARELLDDRHVADQHGARDGPDHRPAQATAVSADAAPLVSAIVLNYNGRGFVEESVQSLLDQDLEGLEVLVVDNGSTDGSAEELARRYGSRIRLAARGAQSGIRRRQQPRHPAGARPLPRSCSTTTRSPRPRSRASWWRQPRRTAGSGWWRPGFSSTHGAT